MLITFPKKDSFWVAGCNNAKERWENRSFEKNCKMLQFFSNDQQSETSKTLSYPEPSPLEFQLKLSYLA
jgi:hypothetical protein